ncbi:MAG: cbb3-type cytochrome oxidase assembly protein CcoS [Gammaproteobacteria bacterium]|jgi:cbb3-type cytochrome oxidase maturation protein|nr:cbb3-type cytochrome oxidase assembly protein CcoS [Gammaproteobacteria bacterium]
MDILYLLIPLALVLVVLIALAFLWSIRSGQFDDLEGPAHRILMDEDEPIAANHNQDTTPSPRR